MEHLSLVWLWGIPVVAQETAIYRLDFTLRETGQVRNYSMIVVNQGRGRVDAEQRIPYESSSANRDTLLRDRESRISVQRVGVSIDCQAREADGPLRLNCAIRSSALAPVQPKQPEGYPPLVHSLRTQVDTAVPLGKTVTVATLEDPGANRKLEVSVVAKKQEE